MDSNERKLAHSDRLVLPRITAPPARSFAATVESCKADMPTSANNPAVVCILSTVASTGSRRQQPCGGDHGHHPLCTREAYKRECLSPLYEEPQARSMPTPETPEVVNVNCSIFSNAGGGWNRGFSHTGLSRGQNLSSSGSMSRVSKLPFHRCWRLSCQLNLVGVAPSVPMLPLSAQHIRGPVVVEIPRSSAAAGGHSPRWHKSWSGPGWKGRTLVFLAAYRARPALVCCGQPPVQALARGNG